MKKFLIFGGVFLSILVIAAIAVVVTLKNIDINDYKLKIESAVEEVTNRDFTVAGEIDLDISLTPKIVVNDVMLANPSWLNDNSMVSVGKVEVQLDLWGLLSKQLVISKILIKSPKIILVKNEEGIANWQFDTKKIDIDVDGEKVDIVIEEEAPITDKKDIKEYLKMLNVKAVEISGGTIAFRDEMSFNKFKLEVNKFEFLSDGLDGDMIVNIDIVYDDKPVKVNSILSSINEIIDNDYLSVKVDGKALDFDLDIEGEIEELTSKPIFDMKMKAANKEVSLDAVVDNKYRDYKIVINEAVFRGNEINGVVVVNLDGKVPNVNAKIKSSKIDLRPEDERDANKADDKEKDKNKNKKETKDNKIEVKKEAEIESRVADKKLPVELLNKVNASIDIDIRQLIVNKDIEADSLKVLAKLNDGVLNINPMGVHILGADIVSNLYYNANDYSAVMKVESGELQISDMVNLNKNKHVMRDGKTKIDINLSSVGKTLDRLKNNLSGKVFVLVNEGIVKSEAIANSGNGVVSDVYKLMGAHLDDDDDIALLCAAVNVDIKSGVFNFKDGISFKSDKFNVLANGVVNSRDDKLTFSVKPYIHDKSDNKIADVVSSLMTVSGSIKKPEIVIDEKDLIKNIGMNLLKINNNFDRKNPCYTSLKNSKYKEYFPVPTVEETDYIKSSDSDKLDAKDVIKTNIKKINTKEVEKVIDDASKVLDSLGIFAN